MRLKGMILGAAIGTLVGAPVFVPTAVAQDSIYVPLFSYRTGPFAGSGIPIANGMADYLNMLNERDGGIGGVKIIVEECETGYDTKKGIECYESVQGQEPGHHQSVLDRHHARRSSRKRRSTRFRCSRWPTVSRVPPTARTSRGCSTRRRPTGTVSR